MSMRNSNDPGWVAVLCRLYSGALWLYPRSHRQRWGADMRLAFRDRCREAARAGRGPASVLFADLLPDLATSVGRECIDEVAKVQPMKRMLVVGLLFALVGLTCQARLGVAAVAMHDWWKQQQAIADIRANDAHLVALAAAVEQTRRGSTDDVTAAMLYWSGADGADRNLSTPGWPRLSAAESAERNELLDRADAAFARALKADDRWALWLAAMDCPARATVCAKDDSLARLRAIDADNGATWLAELYRARDAHDAVRARNALARLAQATHYDTHAGDMVRALFAAFDGLPLPSRLDAGITDPTATAQELAAARRVMQAWFLFAGELGPNYKPLLDYCRTKDAPTDAERANDCLVVGKLLAQSDDSFAITNMIGLRIWLRTAPTETVPQVQQRMRDARWVLQQFAWNFPRENSAHSFLEWKTAWMDGGGEQEMAQRLMRQHGIPLHAPPEFKVDPSSLDPSF
jgi:hypothetical protein